MGGTCFSGPRALVELCRRWRPMVRRTKRSPGYRGHRVWYSFPFKLGTIAFFADREALPEFAGTPEQAELMRWVMQAIDRFTALPGEETGPPVADSLKR